MKLDSWERVELDYRKGLSAVVIVSGLFFALFSAAGTILLLGSLAMVLGAMAGLTAGFLVSTAPRRAVRRAAFLQTLEAPAFAASANIYLKTTSSRNKTLLMLRAEERHLRSFLRDVRKSLLLGYDAESATGGSRFQNNVFSESGKTVVDSVIGTESSQVEEGADELDGFLSSSSLEEETKLPLFIAVCFFLPIMLMLFVAMTRASALVSLGALVVLEVLILDLTLAVSGRDTGSRS